jgi:DNA-binding SARP family transcriptional activator
MAPTCEINVLGPFRVTVAGEVVSGDSWRSRRAADVVKLLAMQAEHRLHREQIMDALWPDLPVDAAAANLRKAVHYARRALGNDDAIVGDGSLVSLWPNGTIQTDFDALMRESDAALGSGSRDACSVVLRRHSFDLLPADRYEPWAEEPRAKVRAIHVELLKGAQEWQRVLDLDPTDEDAHRALMQAYLDSGKRREAIRQFERLRDALRQHVGVGPDPLTVALYERVLEMEGPEPTRPAERAAAMLANGLVAWSRRDLDEAERLARDARTLALAAELGHELGEASTLLALIAYARGSWHDLFREEFITSIRQGPELEMAMIDAHLCFQEFYLYGPEGHAKADDFASELLTVAKEAGSARGEALATLLRGEFKLLSGEIDAAAETLARAVDVAATGGGPSTTALALERLAEAEITRGRKDRARTLLREAQRQAERSSIPSHLVVRVFGVAVSASSSPLEALKIARDAELVLADAPRVCEPCSMNFRNEAARVFARAGDLSRARRQIDEAERITSLWQGGPWKASVWEARAELRRAEGEETQAKALFLEAAEGFAKARRPIDEARCRAAAAVMTDRGADTASSVP